MKSMTWKPDEEHDTKVNNYLEKINHAPYIAIFAAILGAFCGFVLIVLLGVF